MIMKMRISFLLSALFAAALMCAVAFASPGEPAAEDKLKKADEYIKAKKYSQAKEIYREIFLLEKKGLSAEKALFGIGKADYYLKNYYEARQNLKRSMFVPLSQEYAGEANYLLGSISLYMKNFKEAELYFEKASGPFKENAKIGMAEIALKLGDIPKAESRLAEVDKGLLAKDPHAIYVAAMINSRKGKNREAVSLINKLQEAALKDLDIRTDKAQIYFYAYNFREAEKILKNIISKPLSKIETVKAKTMLSQIYEIEGKSDDALKLWQELMPYEPGDELKLRIIAAYEKKGDSEGALRTLSYLKDKRRRAADIEKKLKSVITAGDPKTLEYLTRYAAYVEPDSPFVAEISRYMITNGRTADGMALLRRSAKIVKGEAALYLSELLVKEGKYAEAKKNLEVLVLDSRYIGRASPLLADMLEKEGNYERVIAILLKAAKVSKDFRVAAKLGDLYYKTGDRKNALKYYVMASDNKDGGSSLKAGDFFYIEGNYAKAKLYYKRALDYGIKDAESLQWAQYQYGKLAKDREYLKKAAGGGGAIADAAESLLLEAN
jgi:tetratricopeptide (TPR) repeat protein